VPEKQKEMIVTVSAEPRYRWGRIYPRGNGGGEDPRRQRLVPNDIVMVGVGLGLPEYTKDGVEEAIERYWNCVDVLAEQKADSIELEGLPISAQLGRKRCLELIEETQRRKHLVADTAGEAVAAAIHHLGVTTITIGSRWAEELNQALTRYMEDAGITVLHCTSVGQWAADAAAMSIEEGIKLSVQLGREAIREAPEAEGVLLPGGAWMSLPAVPILEEESGKPVFTNEICRTWRLIHAGVAPPIEGWGRLLATP
jgi:maleate cis-trans isomerase